MACVHIIEMHANGYEALEDRSFAATDHRT
jgi:hypothetical protein